MIASLQGQVTVVKATSIIFEVSGIGLELFTPRPDLFSKSLIVKCHVLLYWHQEQGPILYAFREDQEKLVFELLINSPGVGPKLALVMLAHCSPGDIIQSIIQQKNEAFASVPGIGKKKAEQLILFLKDHAHKLIKSGAFKLESNQQDHYELGQVLHSLGYSQSEAQDALKYAQQDAGDVAFEVRLRKALNFLSKTRK